MGPRINFVLTILILLSVIISKVTSHRKYPKMKTPIQEIVTYPTENISSMALRIVGGTLAKDAEFPYVAGIEITPFQNGPILSCVGSLISSTTILTAAHCLRNVKQAEVILGTRNITHHSADKTKQTFVSTTFITHPNYDRAKKLNDIGIIKLPHPAILNDAVKVIPIPTGDKEAYVNKSGTAMGWGKTSDTIVIPITKELEALQFVTNTILSNEDCVKNHTELRPFIRDTHICLSGQGGRSTCLGDSGGPLVVDGVQIGVSAFGYQLCEGENPSVFTRLSKYIQWINDRK